MPEAAAEEVGAKGDEGCGEDEEEEEGEELVAGLIEGIQVRVASEDRFPTAHHSRLTTIKYKLGGVPFPPPPPPCPSALLPHPPVPVVVDAWATKFVSTGEVNSAPAAMVLAVLVVLTLPTPRARGRTCWGWRGRGGGVGEARGGVGAWGDRMRDVAVDEEAAQEEVVMPRCYRTDYLMAHLYASDDMIGILVRCTSFITYTTSPSHPSPPIHPAKSSPGRHRKFGT